MSVLPNGTGTRRAGGSDDRNALGEPAAVFVEGASVMEVTLHKDQWVQNRQNKQFGQVVEVLPGAYTGMEMLRVKLMDGTCIWSAGRLWAVVKKGGII